MHGLFLFLKVILKYGLAKILVKIYDPPGTSLNLDW